MDLFVCSLFCTRRLLREKETFVKTFEVVIHHGVHRSKVLVCARSLEESMTQAAVILGIRENNVTRIEAKENPRSPDFRKDHTLPDGDVLELHQEE
jgi:hypothetical protein